MRILIHLTKPFWPTLDGGNAASLSLYQQLIDEGNEVDLMIHDTDKHPFQSKHFAHIRNWTIPTKLSIAPISAFRALLANQSYHVDRFRNPAGEEIVTNCLREESFDLVVLDGLYGAAYLDVYRRHHHGKIWLRTHNIEHHIWEQKAAKQTGLKSWYLKRLAAQLKRFELSTFQSVDGILSISSTDSAWMRKKELKAIHDFPFIPAPSNQTYDVSQRDFFHFGSMNWHPNVESYQILTRSIFPRIAQVLPDARLTIAGSFMNTIVLNESANVKHIGFVDHLPTFFSNSGILLAPIQSGSGVRVKILEALSHGVPVVTTSQGIQGFHIQHGEGVFICDEAEDFINCAISLYRDENLRKQASLKAIQTIASLRAQHNLNTIFTEHG